MAVNVKMGVDLGSFNSGIKQGQQILKGLNAEMKATEAEFKVTGNSEKLLTDKTRLLNSQLQAQKGVADQARQALKAMDKEGVDPADTAYQRLYATMMNATAGMNNAQAELNALGTSAQTAAAGADQLTDSVNSIGKKISLDQVRSGIQSITDGLESAAKKAVDLGERLFNVIMESAAQADDISTMATRLGLTDEQVQKMMYVADAFEAPVESMAKTWKKVKMNMTSDSDDIVAGFQSLGVATHEVFGGKYGEVQGAARDYIDVFWEVGEALMNVKDASEQERLAQKLLGRSWDEMIPLFTKGREAYEEAVEKAPAASEKAVENAASLNDRVKELEKSWDTLKLEVVGAISPALEKGADALGKVLDQLTQYLQSEDGQKLLEGLGTAITNLFEDLGNISAEDLANNVTAVITGLTNGLNWLNDNWESVKAGLIGIVTAWAALEISGGIIDIIKMVSGIGSIAGSAATAGATAGASWGTAFAGAVAKAAPWLIGLYTLLNPAAGSDTIGDNTIIDENGKLTGEAELYGYKQNEAGETYLDRRQIIEDAAQTAWDLYRTNQFDAAALSALKETVMSDAGFSDLVDLFMGTRNGNENWKSIEDLDLTEWANKYGLPEVPIDLTPATDASEIAEEVGPVKLPVILSFSGGGRSADVLSQITGHANGLPFVQNDGLYLLHKGETVTPAREVQSRSYNSNLYVESMYMNNGTDAAGLASAMAAAQQRTMSGYGS